MENGFYGKLKEDDACKSACGTNKLMGNSQYGTLIQINEAEYMDAIKWRRILHSFPQPAWLEFFATSVIAEKLADWGYELQLGKNILVSESRRMLPSKERLRQEYQRALENGAKEEYLVPAQGGFTGVVGTITGQLPGPTIAFRFDIDCNEIQELMEMEHRPYREGFVSKVSGYAHMCGHDVHTAIGLLLARNLAKNRHLIRGSVKFIFQPAEEALCGALPMVEKGIVDDVDYLLAGHVGINLTELGTVALDIYNILALSRFYVTYLGQPIHSSVRPDKGRNAMLGACTAIMNLYGIARHGHGNSYINVGTMQSGNNWNVIPEEAMFQVETRGTSDEINRYMAKRVEEILEHSARMHGLKSIIEPVTMSVSSKNSPELIELSNQVATSLPTVKEIVRQNPFNASEDYAVMMNRVQQRGGQALYAMFGTPVFGGHHSSNFDVEELVMRNAAEFFTAMYYKLASCS